MICPVCKVTTSDEGHMNRKHDIPHNDFVREECKKIDALFNQGYCGSDILKVCYFGKYFLYNYLHATFGRDRVIQNSGRVTSSKIMGIHLTEKVKQERYQLERRYTSGVDGIDFVTCKICQKKMDQLSLHVKKVHHLSWKEYTKQYGNTQNLSKFSSDKISKYLTNHNPMEDDNIKLKASKNRLKKKKHLYTSTANVGHIVRSSWEEFFALLLQKLEINYKYEAETFILKADWGTFTYTPDFYIEVLGLFVEIKGWMDKASKLKLWLFRKLYPYVTLVVIEKEEYELLQTQFKESLHLEKGDSKLDYMRENLLSILRYLKGKNSTGADDPQGSLSDPSETIRQVSSAKLENDIVRAAQRCAEVDRNDLPSVEKL